MNNEDNKFLPLGTIVLLKGAKKRIMITGFMISVEESDGKVFDYMGCLYPEGTLNSEQNLVFDHEQIDKIYYMGYSDDEEKAFKVKLNEILIQNNNSDSPAPQTTQPVVNNPVEPQQSQEFTIPTLNTQQQAQATFNTLNLNDFNN